MMFALYVAPTTVLWIDSSLSSQRMQWSSSCFLPAQENGPRFYLWGALQQAYLAHNMLGSSVLINKPRNFCTLECLRLHLRSQDASDERRGRGGTEANLGGTEAVVWSEAELG